MKSEHSRIAGLRPGDPRRLGPYSLIGRLGGGGMGVVFLARGTRGGLVAVKSLRSELAEDPVFVSRFRQEVKAASQVESPRTARVLGADLDTPQPYLVTEYVPGPTLQAYLDSNGPLEEAQLVAFAAALADALAAIHACGVMHRDLKPLNVLLTEEGPRLIDFGIARALDATQITRTGMYVGTPAWMAPEQAKGEEAGLASDIFSWGALVALAATGRSPFGRGTAEEVLYRVVHHEPDLAGLPSSVEPVVRRALSKDTSERPTAAELVGLLLPQAGSQSGEERSREVTAALQRAWEPAFAGRLDTGVPRLLRYGRVGWSGRLRVAAIVGAMVVVLAAVITWVVRSSEPPTTPGKPASSGAPAGPENLPAYVTQVAEFLQGSAAVRAHLSLEGCYAAMAKNGPQVSEVLRSRQRALATVRSWSPPPQAEAAQRLLVESVRHSAAVDLDVLHEVRAVARGDGAACRIAHQAFVRDDPLADRAKAEFLAEYNRLRAQLGLDSLEVNF